jgi:hypothetical protein
LPASPDFFADAAPAAFFDDDALAAFFGLLAYAGVEKNDTAFTKPSLNAL